MSQPIKKRSQVGAPTPVKPAGSSTMEGIFAGLFGVLLGLALLKFGNPIIMERLIDWPTNVYQWFLISWPLVIGYWLLTGVTVAGLLVIKWKPNLPKWLIVLPLVWLAWEFIAAMQTESSRLTQPTLVHFLTCVVCFYLGLFALSGSSRMGAFWSGLLPGFFLVLASGFEQHFGGLAESRRWYMYTYAKPGAVIDPAFLAKINKDRIFATLFYPNTLAGVILVLLPITLVVLWSMRERFTGGARKFLVSATALAALACLYWSESKGGWLLMLLIVMVGAMFLPVKKQLKVTLVVAVLALGLAGFTAKYLGFFKKGATSVVARFDYWEAAVKTVKSKPLFGTGPGTFGIAYERVRRPDSEMAQMTHNDYLQQASDSGVIGFVVYLLMIVSLLVYTFRKGRLSEDWIRLAVWLGVLGWALHCLMEFELYIPALAWLVFALMGWLVGECGNPSDNPKTTSHSGARQ